MQRVVDRAVGRRLGDLSEGRGRRVLAFCQAVDAVVEHHNVDVQVSPNGVHQVISTDAHAIAVSRDNPNLHVGRSAFEATGKPWRASVNTVHAIRFHVVRKTARATDPGNENDVFLRHAERRQHLLHLRQNGIVAAPRAPAHILIALKTLRSKNWQFSAHLLVP